jgi:anaerobic carbon-monoxide dehydrogenase iron sulfur subunit
LPNDVRLNVLFTNPKTCIGCRACEVYCSFRHYKENNPARALLHVVKYEEHSLDIPVVCHHCDRAPCQEACPVGAISRDKKTNAVIISREKCIGCRACITACPFNVIVVDPQTELVVKCDLCDGKPKCAEVCPKAAIIFARRDLGPKLLMRGYTSGLIDPLIREIKSQASK